MLQLLRHLFLPLLLCAAGQASAATEVVLSTYYDYAPWTYENQPARGLNPELARLLTELAAGKYRFTSRVIPRKRVDMMLAQGDTLMVVAWVAPRFVGDEAHTRYLWTPPLMEDESLIVSPKDTPLEYEGLDSLIGKRFSATLGHVYGDIDPLVRAGKVVRSDGPSMESAIRKLLLHRDVDFGVLDRSTLRAFQEEGMPGIQQLHVAKLPRTPQYTRHILVPKSRPELAEFLNQAVRQLTKARRW
jgi:polar amino acid transport system substrate-binding protein